MSLSLRDVTRSPWPSRIARTCLILVGFGPWWVALSSGMPVLDHLLLPLESWYHFQCHRDPGRTWEFFGATLPVCVRCSGIYAGLGAGAVSLWPRLAPTALRLWVVIAAGVMILDVVSESFGLRPPWPWLRFFSGLCLAFPVGSAVVRVLHAPARGAPS